MGRDLVRRQKSAAWGTLGRRDVAKATEAEPEAVCDPNDPCVILLTDVSLSMEGNRLREAKEGAHDYAVAATARGHAVGAVAFSGSAFIVAPPTRQPARLASKIAALTTLPTGTNIADAIIVGMSLVSRAAASKILVLCTDGEPKDAILTDREARDQAVAAATRAKAAGFLIHALAIHGADVEFLRKIVSNSTLLREASDRAIQSAMRSLVGLLPSPK